jgi:hypothetical protein
MPEDINAPAATTEGGGSAAPQPLEGEPVIEEAPPEATESATPPT